MAPYQFYTHKKWVNKDVSPRGIAWLDFILPEIIV